MLTEGNGISVKFLIVIATLAVFGFAIDEAFADIPNIDTFVADDPDNGDTVLSDGDTLTITFSLPINATASGAITQAEIDANFTTGAATIGTTYTGVWSADTLSLLITIIDAATGDLVVDTTTIGVAAGNNLGHAGDAGTPIQLTGTPTLTGDFGLLVAASGGSGCDRECSAPTLGVNSAGNRLVDNGFSYNGKAVDVESFYTSYPLVTAFINRDNTATFKIYEDQGPQNIRHVALAFGLGNGQMFTNSKAVIDFECCSIISVNKSSHQWI